MLTGKAPILPVMILVAGYDARQASKQLGRILGDPKRSELKEAIGLPIRLNNHGNALYCATGQQMHRILMCLPPGRFSDSYMDECSRVLWMRDTGDQRLIDEVHHNRTAALANGGVPTMGSLFGPPGVPDVTAQVQPPELAAASTKRSIAMMEAEVESVQLALFERRQNLQVALVEQRKDDADHALRVSREVVELRRLHALCTQEEIELLESMGATDDHSRWAYRDRVHNFDPLQYLSISRIVPQITEAPGAAPGNVTAHAAEVAPGDVTLSGALHAQAGNLLQVHEILELRMGVSSPEAARLSNAFGRVIAPMYRERYNLDEPPKKNREIKGLVKGVNAYPPVDWPWIQVELQRLMDEHRAEPQARVGHQMKRRK